MTPRVAVIDTNVIVAGLLTGDPESPTARVLNGMLAGRFPFLLSVELVAEYRQVLLREEIRARHRLDEPGVDRLLIGLVANAAVREPAASPAAPDPGDQHLWDLLAAERGSVLVSGDRALAEDPPSGVEVRSPASFAELLDDGE